MTTPRIAIIGGGAIGTSTAFHLGREGAEVDLFDRESIASGSTDRALGDVRYLFAHPLSVAAMAHGLRFFERFEAIEGIEGIDAIQIGFFGGMSHDENEQTLEALAPE